MRKNHVLKSSKSKIIFSDIEQNLVEKNYIKLQFFYKQIKVKSLKILNSNDRFIIFIRTTSKPKVQY